MAIRLENDAFLSTAEQVKQGSPVPYPRREEMLKLIKKLKGEQEQA